MFFTLPGTLSEAGAPSRWVRDPPVPFGVCVAVTSPDEEMSSEETQHRAAGVWELGARGGGRGELQTGLMLLGLVHRCHGQGSSCPHHSKAWWGLWLLSVSWGQTVLLQPLQVMPTDSCLALP